MILGKERVTVLARELKKVSKVQGATINQWQKKSGEYLDPAAADASGEPWEAFDSRKDHWYGPDKHDWFRTAVTVPECFDGKPLWLIIHTQIDEWDDAKNPQFLLFVDGEIVQGIDMNHREVLLTSKAKAGREYQIDLQSYTGIIHSEFRLMGEMAEFDPEIQALYYDIQVPLWGLERMEKDDKIYLDIVTILNATVQLLDFRQVYSKEFYDSVKDARAYIQKALYEDYTGTDVIATCIGHTHIDVAWWWTVAQTRQKVGRSFATVLKLMEEYPGYKFMSSQPQLYQFLKERYPKLYEQVKERVKEGRWEPEGGMWVEADCNLTSGESLVRQFIYGKRFFREEFGIDNRVLWLPDVFGYSAALPQIMEKCGIDYFMTTKLAWNQFNKIPNDTFLWRGIDGTEILTHFISTLGVGQSIKNFFTTYNGMLHPDAIMGGWKRYLNKEINNDILISYGYGDGGGGPTREMLETSKRMEKGVKGIPKVRQEFAGKYFKELEERVQNNPQLTVWSGELYFEYHRGTYTSMSRNKRSNRKCEYLLMDLELLSILAQNRGTPYPVSKLTDMWKTVLLNQFHDILPGSSVKEVYEVTKEEYAAIEKEAAGLIQADLDVISKDASGVTLFNTAGFVRDDMTCLGDVDAAALVDEAGKAYPVQMTGDGAYVWVEGLPSKGYRGYELSGSSAGEKEISRCGETPFRIEGYSIETPFYKVSFDDDGFMASVYDKEFERELFLQGEKGNLLRVYEDKPQDYDNWDIEIYYKEKHWDVDQVVSMEWIACGSLMAVLEVKKEFCGCMINQKIKFYGKSRRIDFETYVDWKMGQHLLKAHFPLDVHTDEASFDIQFGNVTRKTHKNTSWDVARFESCGHKWADVSEGGFGVSLLNDCKYGHSVEDTNIGLTLLKSGILPNPTTDQEEHRFTYSLYPHKGGFREGNTMFEAVKLNQPVLSSHKGEAGEEYSFAAVDQPNVMLETVKLAEDGSGVIVRLYEYQNARTKVKLTFGNRVQSAAECNLLEETVGDVKTFDGGIEFVIKPYEIKTFKVKF